MGLVTAGMHTCWVGAAAWCVRHGLNAPAAIALVGTAARAGLGGWLYVKVQLDCLLVRALKPRASICRTLNRPPCLLALRLASDLPCSLLSTYTAQLLPYTTVPCCNETHLLLVACDGAPVRSCCSMAAPWVSRSCQR